MSDTLQEELRDLAREWFECCGDIHLPLKKAADRIEELEAKALANKVAIMRLEAENARLRDALQAINSIDRSLLPKDCDFRVNAMRIARAALQDT